MQTSDIKAGVGAWLPAALVPAVILWAAALALSADVRIGDERALAQWGVIVLAVLLVPLAGGFLWRRLPALQGRNAAIVAGALIALAIAIPLSISAVKAAAACGANGPVVEAPWQVVEMMFYAIVAGVAFAGGGLVMARRLAQGRRLITAIGFGLGAEALGLAFLFLLVAAAAAGPGCNRG